MARQRVHRDDARRFLWGIGVIALLLLVTVVGAVVQTGGALPGRRYTYVKAAFETVGVLEKGKDVKQAGITVGTISGLAYRHGAAVVTLRLNGRHDVYADATVAVGNGSALGKKFISFDPGTPAAGPLGNREISVARTRSASQLEDVFGSLDPRTRSALQSTLGQLGTGMVGHSQHLNDALAASPELLADLRTVAQAVTAPEADLPGLLESADRLVGRFQGREAQLASLLDNADDTVRAVGVDRGAPLEQTIGRLPATLSAAQGALDSLGAPLANARVAVTDLRPGAAALGASTPDLRLFLRNSRSTLAKVPSVAKKATVAEGDLTTTLRDARPLLPPLQSVVASLDRLLYDFSPYAGDAGRFFSQDALLSGTLGSDDRHYFAAALTAVGLSSIAGLPDPLFRSETYPCPGAAWNHAILTDCSGGAR